MTERGYEIRRRRRQRVVTEDRSVTPEWPRVVDLLHRSAGQSTGCWDGLGDASSFAQGDGREIVMRLHVAIQFCVRLSVRPLRW